MAFNYTRSRATADRLIKKFGQAGALRRKAKVAGGPKPWSPVAVDPAPADIPCRFAIVDFNKRDIDGTSILATDQRAFISAIGLTEEPTTSHTLLVQGVEREIVTLSPLAPAGIAVYYEAQIR